MKIFWIFLALIFIILTLGIIDVEIGFTDGSHITYHGWLRMFNR